MLSIYLPYITYTTGKKGELSTSIHSLPMNWVVVAFIIREGGSVKQAEEED